MSTYLIVCGQQVEIGRRVVSFLEAGAPNFYLAQQEGGQELLSPRAGVPETADLSLLASKVQFIILHHDATWNSQACFQVLKNRNLSTHLMIDGDGTIYQPADLRDSTWHAGGIFNQIGIGIDMNNVATLELLRDSDTGRRYQEGRGGLITNQIHGARITSTGYTEAQYQSLVAVIVGLHKVLPLIKLFPPLDASGEVINTKLVNAWQFKGWMGHWHISADKWDPGPGFDWRRVMVGIHGERNSMPVELPGAAKLQDVFSASEVFQIAEKFYLNAESSQSGFYPISTSQAWHSGINLQVNPRDPVYCMANGQIVAVRNAQAVELGHANFVLVRHKIRSKPKEQEVGEGEAPKKEEAKETFVEKVWYSLYMYLDHLTDQTPPEQRPTWFKNLGADELGGEKFDEEELRADDEDRRPRAGKTFRDLRRGDVILMDPLEVKAGEIIGYAGSFGPTEDLQRPVVHVEAFSSEPDPFFDPTEFPDTWKLVESDEGNDSLADIEQLWRPILESTEFLRDEKVRLVRGQRILTGSEIREFFQGDSLAKQTFRGYVCRHVSEWSDGLDWSRTAAIAVGWQWQTREAYEQFLKKWQPFMWLSAELAEHAGINKERVVWTYHPVTLLAWLHTNYGRQLSPEEFQEGFALSALAEERKKDRELLYEKGGWHGEGEVDGAQLQDIEDEDVQLQLDDDVWKQWEQGEWDLPQDVE
jgi:N-acetyl-anhydromuramyl-L-alanine amidase AmpD